MPGFVLRSLRRHGGPAVLAISALAVRAPGQSPELPLVTDTIWYVTNRLPAGQGWRDERGTLSFGLRAFRVGSATDGDVLWSSRLATRIVADSARGREAWVAGLTEAVVQPQGAERPVLLYVHGYGTSFDEATSHAAELRRRGGFEGPVVVFSWPSRGSGIAWPTLDHPLTQAYWRDAARGTESVPDLVEVIGELARAVGPSRLVVAAHSLGNRLVDLALRDSVLAAGFAVAPLRALAFLAPDVDATWFADSTLVMGRRVSSRQVVYGARNDRVLAASSLVNGTPRAGRLEGIETWASGAEVLDVTDGEIAGNWWTRHFGTNHALRRRPAAVLDLFRIVLPGMPDECRAVTGLMARDPGGYWRVGRASGRPAAPEPGACAGAPGTDAARFTP